MATSPLPLSAAQVLRRHVWRRVLIAALMTAVGIVLLGIQRAELIETAVLLRRGVSTEATVINNERLDGLWTALTVEFPGRRNLSEVAVILHEGVVDAGRVQIVYDPLDPSTAQLEGDLQPGMLAWEFAISTIALIFEDDDESRFQFANIGFLLVIVALVMLVRVLNYRHRLLRIAGQPPHNQELRMWLRSDGAKDTDALLERPSEGAATWLRVELLPHQDLHGLTEPGRTVQALGEIAERRWLIIRAPDGRLLLPKATAKQVASAEVNVQGLKRPTRNPHPQAVQTVGAPSLSCLLYLAAERVMPTHPNLRFGRISLSSGISVPCRELRVHKRTLRSAVLAAAFVDLRDSGRVTLDVITKSTGQPSPWDQSHELSVMLLDTTERPGLPGALLGATRPYGDRVKAIHTRMMAAASRNKWPSLEQSAKAELAELGYALDDCERLAELHDACEQAVTRWREFKTSESLLCEVLESECWAATSPE